jgi:HSP20 family molecular chaperone IbpA
VLLPGEVEEEGVEATLNEGVPSVQVPKAASERRRRIAIK